MSSSDEESDSSVDLIEDSSATESEVEDCPFFEKVAGTLRLKPNVLCDAIENPSKKLKISPELNGKLLEVAEQLTSCWTKNEPEICDLYEVIAKPFKVGVINNLLDNSTFLTLLRQEMHLIDWNHRVLDLYNFYQSKDLKDLIESSTIFGEIRNFLKTDLKNLISQVTGYTLTEVSATCSLYKSTNFLLVHDDQREDRMVAFVLYLTGPQGWSQDKGGALQLLDKDSSGQPLNVVRDILPANNQLVFFPVTSDSYHQVAEVTSSQDCRLSINGWFHTQPPPSHKTPHYETPSKGLFSKEKIHAKKLNFDLKPWINSKYFDASNITCIQSQMEEESQISLKGFFLEQPLGEVVQLLDSSKLKWVKIGPPNRYNYEVLDLHNLPAKLESFTDLFQSEEMFKLLVNLTQLELLGEESGMKFELQRWVPGSYCLLSDFPWMDKTELDVIVYLGCKDTSQIIGGRTQYVTLEDETQEALITLEPEDNTLNMVLRDVARFTQHFSVQSTCKKFYTLFCSYSEK